MLTINHRALALLLIAFAFCFLPVAAAMACEACPPDQCHDEVVRHSAPQMAVQNAPVVPATAIGRASLLPPDHAAAPPAAERSTEDSSRLRVPLRL